MTIGDRHGIAPARTGPARARRSLSKSFRPPAEGESLSPACPRERDQREGHPASAPCELILYPEPLCAAVRRGRQAAQRESTGGRLLFASTRMCCRKARSRLTNLLGGISNKRQAGWPLFTPGILPYALRAGFAVRAAPAAQWATFLWPHRETWLGCRRRTKALGFWKASESTDSWFKSLGQTSRKFQSIVERPLHRPTAPDNTDMAC